MSLTSRSASPAYLEFLPSNGLHVALLADSEVVGDFGISGVDVGPAEGVAILGDFRDHLVVTALLDDVFGDACREQLVQLQCLFVFYLTFI